MNVSALLALGICLWPLASCNQGRELQSHHAGTLTVGVLYTVKPALYRDDQGNLTGFLYDVEVALGQRLKRPLDFKVTTFENIITGVESGKFDIGSGTDATVEREKILDIVPIYEGGYTLRARSEGPLVGPAMKDLCGLRIGTTAGGVILPLLRSTARRCHATGRPPLTLLTMPTDSLLVLALQSRRIDGMIAFDWYPPPPGTVLTGPTFSTAQTGIAVRKNSPLAAQLVAALNSLIADGTYGRILARYGVSRTALPKCVLDPAR